MSDQVHVPKKKAGGGPAPTTMPALAHGVVSAPLRVQPVAQRQSAFRASMEAATRARLMPSIPSLEDRRSAFRSSHSPGDEIAEPGPQFETPIQRLENPAEPRAPPPRRNDTGLPDRLKTGVEALSGLSMDDVKVHYGSSKPAQIQALAYAQGTDIHVGPGQERHLPHEAWHVVQQKQGRVKTSLQNKHNILCSDPALESEADLMGLRAKSQSGPAVGIGHSGGPRLLRIPILMGDARAFTIQPKLKVLRNQGAASTAVDGGGASSSSAAAAAPYQGASQREDEVTAAGGHTRRAVPDDEERKSGSDGSSSMDTDAATGASPWTVGSAAASDSRAANQPPAFAPSRARRSAEAGGSRRVASGSAAAAAVEESPGTDASAAAASREPAHEATVERAWAAESSASSSSAAAATGAVLAEPNQYGPDRRSRRRAPAASSPYSGRPTAAERLGAAFYQSPDEICQAVLALGNPSTVTAPVVEAIPRLWKDGHQRQFNSIGEAFREIVHEIAPINAMQYVMDRRIRAGNTSQGIIQSKGKSYSDAWMLQHKEFNKRVTKPLISKYGKQPGAGDIIHRHIEGMASVLLQSGNCDEFSSIIMMKLMEQVTDQWVGKAYVVGVEHRFIILSRNTLEEGPLTKRNSKDTVIDAWFAYEISTASQYARTQGKNLTDIVIDEVHACTGKDVITPEMTADLQGHLSEFQSVLAKNKEGQELTERAKKIASEVERTGEDGGDEDIDVMHVPLPDKMTDTRPKGGTR